MKDLPLSACVFVIYVVDQRSKKFMNCVMLDMILSPMKVIIIYVFRQANSGAPELLIVTGKAKN